MSIGCPFLPIFYKKILLPFSYFVKKHLFSKNTLFICIYMSKNAHSLKGTMLSSHFFNEKPLLLCPYLLKNVNSVKTTVYYGPKKSIGYPFFQFLTKKYLLLCLYFVKKRLFSKKRWADAYIYVNKTPFLSKYNSRVIGFGIFMKNPCCHALFGQKTSILSKLRYIIN